MKRIFALLSTLILCFCVLSCTKEGVNSINGKWFDDYKYSTDSPEEVRTFTNGEYIIIDGNTITFYDGDFFDGTPLRFSYENGKMTIGAFVWTVNKITKTAFEIQSDDYIRGFKR